MSVLSPSWPRGVMRTLRGLVSRVIQANLVAIVGYVVVSAAGLPDDQQGLATGLVTTSQQVGITLGTPTTSVVIAAVVGGAAAPVGSALLPGIRTTIGLDGVLCIAAAIVVAALRRPRR